MGTDPLLALGPPSAIAEEGREAREPVADIVLAPSRIHVTLELPGASRETLEVTATDIRLKIHALGPNGLVYRSDLELPAPVEPEAVGVTYHNSVLDVTLPRRRGHRVRLTKRD
jgi:HSP20 family molecular chaperone IbpA